MFLSKRLRTDSMLALLLCFVAPAFAGGRVMPLNQIRSFMYQLQGLENRAAVDALAKSDYDLLVIEPTATCKGDKEFDAQDMVARLRAGKPGRIVLAYVDIGQAETYRYYWGSDWKKPSKGRNGHPDFLLGLDPDGWKDNYMVAFWDPQWLEVMATGQHNVTKTIMGYGFDGLYLDWVEAYTDEGVVEAAKKRRIAPARAMVDLIGRIRDEASKIRPGALIVAQNAPFLIEDDAGYAKVVDGIAFEGTWFRGEAEAPWNSSRAGDVVNDSDDRFSTSTRLQHYAKIRTAGKVVLTIDYCVEKKNADRVYEEAAQHGFVALVTRVPLDRITTTPPPSLRRP